MQASRVDKFSAGWTKSHQCPKFLSHENHKLYDQITNKIRNPNCECLSIFLLLVNSRPFFDTMHQIEMILITVLIFQHPITEVTCELWGLKMESLNMSLPISPTRKVFSTCQASPHRTSLSVNRLHQHFFHTLPDSSK